jgi:hypothetical protein
MDWFAWFVLIMLLTSFVVVEMVVRRKERG